MLRLPASRPASLVALARRYHLRPRIRSPLRSGGDGEGPGAFSQGRLRRPVSRWRMRDLPGSWGVPMCTCPALRPRGVDALSPLPSTPMLPSDAQTTSASRKLHFEALSHSLHTRCLRFAAPVTRRPRKTRFRLLARLCRAGLYPLDSSTRFQGGALAILSSSSRLNLAQLNRELDDRRSR